MMPDYERAARLRDDIKALERAMEKQAVVLADGTDADVIALAEDPLEAAVQVFYVRGGRVRGQRGWIVDKIEDLTTGDLVEHFLQQVYGEGRADAWGDTVPREVLVPALPEDAEAVTAWLRGLRGGNVDLRVPRRGEKRALMETVARNAGQSLALHKTRRGSDLTTRSQALEEIQVALQLPEVDTAALVQVHRRQLVELMQQYTRLKEDAAADDVSLGLVVDAELFRLDAVVRWLDAAEARVRRLPPGEAAPVGTRPRLPRRVGVAR